MILEELEIVLCKKTKLPVSIGHTKMRFPRGCVTDNNIRILIPQKTRYSMLDAKNALAVLAHEIGHIKGVNLRKSVPIEIQASIYGLMLAKKWRIVPEFAEHEARRVPKHYAKEVREDVEKFLRRFEK